MHLNQNNILKFKKNLKKLKRNINLKKLKLLFLENHEVVVFANFNFYNFLNISIFKDILEKNNVKYLYLTTSEYNFYVKNNLMLKLFKNLNISNNSISILKELFINKNYDNNSLNDFYKYYNSNNLLNSSFSKNFNIILFLDYKSLSNNVLETLKVFVKLDPLYIKLKSHNKLVSYNYLVNNIIKKEKNLEVFKPLVCNFVLYNNIRILKMVNLKNNNE